MEDCLEDKAGVDATEMEGETCPKCWKCGSTEHLTAFHKKTGSDKKPTSMNTTHVTEEDSNLEEGVFGIQDNSSDDEKNDDDGRDWFSAMDEDVFEGIWDLEES